MAEVRVAVVGANGYTGGELLRYLAQHPHVRVVAATSRSRAGVPLTREFPHLAGANLPETFVDLDAAGVAAAADVAFTCLPHGESQPWVADLVAAGTLVIDLSADFRYHDLNRYEAAYLKHAYPELATQAAYGLVEYNRQAIASAKLIANPGCYPTSVLLATLPAAQRGWLADAVIADCQSGSSGAGRTPKPNLLHGEIHDNLKAYGLPTHRHQSEMEHGIERFGGGATEVIFTPHLAPVARGILSTVHLTLRSDIDPDTAIATYRERYAPEPFVTVLPSGDLPQTAAVRGTNRAHVALVPRSGGRITVLVAIDNLGKGAAGQAVQNLNVRMGWAETAGLYQVAALP